MEFRQLIMGFKMLSVLLCTLSMVKVATSGLSKMELAELKPVLKALSPQNELEVVDTNFDFQIFCRKGDPKVFFYYFRTASLRLFSSAEDIKLIKHHSALAVLREYQQTSKWTFWVANFLPWRARDTNFPTFNTSCIGVVTSMPYTASLIVKPVDMWKVATLIAGLIIFLFSPTLTQSAVFFYSSGTLLGTVGTVLVALYIVYRFLPRSKSGIITMSVLWSIIVYAAGETWSRIEELLHQRLPYIIGVITIGSVTSFLVCYRFGPPTNPRSIDIYRWTLQFIGLFLIHWSSDLIELSSAIIIGCVVWYNCCDFFKRKFWHAWYIFMPQRARTRLLTQEEFIEQGAVETIKALDELKSFCNSPDAKPWTIVSRLKDPQKFSSFVEGDSHLSDEEILAHDVFENDSVDEDEEIDEELNNERFGRTLRQDANDRRQVHSANSSAHRRIGTAAAHGGRGSAPKKVRMTFTSTSAMQNGGHARSETSRTSLPSRGTIYPTLSSESLLTDDDEPQFNFETDDDE